MTIVGAVSPPGGDFSDPVTSATLGIVQVCTQACINGHFTSSSATLQCSDLSQKAALCRSLSSRGAFSRPARIPERLLSVVFCLGSEIAHMSDGDESLGGASHECGVLNICYIVVHL